MGMETTERPHTPPVPLTLQPGHHTAMADKLMRLADVARELGLEHEASLYEHRIRHHNNRARVLRDYPLGVCNHCGDYAPIHPDGAAAVGEDICDRCFNSLDLDPDPDGVVFSDDEAF